MATRGATPGSWTGRHLKAELGAKGRTLRGLLRERTHGDEIIVCDGPHFVFGKRDERLGAARR